MENKYENKYISMPDRSHYVICSDRLADIKSIGQRAFYYTFIVALLLAAGSMFNIRFNILSLLADLAVGYNSNGGTSGVILSGMLNIISSLFLIIMSALGTSRYKFCHVFLFSLYLSMIISCFIFQHRESDIITLALGSAGVVIYFPTLKAWRDYKHISEAEGFPYFSERFAQQLENPKYKSNYNENYADEEKPMDELDKTAEIINPKTDEKTDNKEKITMDTPSETPAEIPKRGDAKKKKSRLEMARELAEKANKFDFEINEINNDTGDKK